MGADHLDDRHPSADRLGDAVRIWRIRLDDVDLGLAASILDPDEIGRAEKLATPLLRRRFLSRRLALRQILGVETGIDPARLAIEQGTQGKPRLLDQSGLFFNTSHSGALALLAVSARGEIGIDVERVRDIPSWTEIVAEFFEKKEQDRLLRRQNPTVGMFLSYWTRKEAVTKATGLGLGLPLSSFRVPEARDAEDAVVTIRGMSGAARKWHVRGLVPGPDHIAALASARACPEVTWLEYPAHTRAG